MSVWSTKGDTFGVPYTNSPKFPKHTHTCNPSSNSKVLKRRIRLLSASVTQPSRNGVDKNGHARGGGGRWENLGGIGARENMFCHGRRAPRKKIKAFA